MSKEVFVNFIIALKKIIIYLIDNMSIFTNDVLSRIAVLPKLIIDYIDIMIIIIILDVIAFAFLKLISEILYKIYMWMNKNCKNIIKENRDTHLKKINVFYLSMLKNIYLNYNKINYLAGKIIGFKTFNNREDGIIQLQISKSGLAKTVFNFFMNWILLNYKVNAIFIFYEYCKNIFVRNGIDYLIKMLINKDTINIMIVIVLICLLYYKGSNRGVLQDLNSNAYKDKLSKIMEFYRDNLKNIARIFICDSRIVYNLLGGIDFIIIDIQYEVVENLDLAPEQKNNIYKRINIKQRNYMKSAWYDQIQNIDALDNLINNIKALEKDGERENCLLLNRYDYRFCFGCQLFYNNDSLSSIITKNTLNKMIDDISKRIQFYIPDKIEEFENAMYEDIIKELSANRIKNDILNISIKAIEELIVLNELINCIDNKINLNRDIDGINSFEKLVNLMKRLF